MKSVLGLQCSDSLERALLWVVEPERIQLGRSLLCCLFFKHGCVVGRLGEDVLFPRVLLGVLAASPRVAAPVADEVVKTVRRTEGHVGILAAAFEYQDGGNGAANKTASRTPDASLTGLLRS